MSLINSCDRYTHHYNNIVKVYNMCVYAAYRCRYIPTIQMTFNNNIQEPKHRRRRRRHTHGIMLYYYADDNNDDDDDYDDDDDDDNIIIIICNILYVKYVYVYLSGYPRGRYVFSPQFSFGFLVQYDIDILYNMRVLYTYTYIKQIQLYCDYF